MRLKRLSLLLATAIGWLLPLVQTYNLQSKAATNNALRHTTQKKPPPKKAKKKVSKPTKTKVVSASSHPPKEEEDPFAPILDLPLGHRVIDYLIGKYEEGSFDKIELGGRYGQSNTVILVRLFGLLIVFLWMGTLLGGCVWLHWYHLYRDLEEWLVVLVFYPFLSIILFALILECRKLYSNYLSPGYIFFTDRGIILIEPGGIEKASCLYYDDIQWISTLVVNPEIEPKEVLRVIDKELQTNDYNFAWIGPRLHGQVYRYLLKKLPDSVAVSK